MIEILSVIMIIASLWLLYRFYQRGSFDSVSLFDKQPQSLGVYNLVDIEPVILKSA